MLEMFLNSKAGAGLASGLATGLTSALGGGPAGPSNATGGAYGTAASGFGHDGSGWSVNFGSGAQTVTANQDKSGGVPGLGVSGVGAVSAVPWWAWLLVGGSVLWKLKKSK